MVFLGGARGTARGDANSVRNGHLDVEDLRDAMEALPAGPAMPVEAPIPTAIPVAAGETFAPHGAPVVRATSSGNEAARNRRNSPLDPVPYSMGPAGFEPACQRG